MKKANLFKSIFVIFLLSLAVAFICEAEQKQISPELEKGIGRYKHENYEEALITLKEAVKQDPESSLAAYYIGLTYKQMQDYKDAVPYLKDAVIYKPKIKGALIELVDCLYHLDRLDEAKAWIEEAELDGIRPAQVAFIKGLILSREENYSEAVDSFKNAMNLDRSMSQACKYQIGMARLKENKFDEAKQVFNEVVIVDPSSNMANYANEYIDALSKRQEASRPLKLTFGFAWQYDDNVILKPSDTTLAADITDKADAREVYTAQAEYNKRFNKFVGVKGQYLFYYGKQNRLGFYDLLSNTFAIQPSLYYKDSMLTFPIGWSLTNVNDKFYLSTPTASAVFNQMFGKSNMAQAYIKYQNRNYIWGPSIAAENRDGNEIAGGLGWYFFYAKNKGFLNLRYAANRDWTTGANWNYIGNRMAATLLVPVMDKFNWTISGDIFMQGFTRSNSIVHIYRKDRVYTISTLFAYKFYKDSELQAQYTFVKDDSNISVYGYNRNITSLGVQLKF